MRKYISWQQLSKLSLLVLGITYLGQISWLNLILGWGLPLILSSLQLFTFGTFFPHRRLETDGGNTHQIHSLNLSPFWSFIACYNFAYHWEHHQYPHLPWWKLSLVKTNKSSNYFSCKQGES
jgi:beta-carotene ketolase (CrtW type)